MSRTNRFPRLGRNRVAPVRSEARIFVTDRDYIPSCTADMWKAGKRGLAR